jgi:hypothetical protein
MKKEYMIPEMELVEMDYENSLLCGSPGEEPCPTDEPMQSFPTETLTGNNGLL